MSRKQRKTITEDNEKVIYEEEVNMESTDILCDSCDHKDVCKYVEDMRRIETETEMKYNNEDRPIKVVLDCESYIKENSTMIRSKLPWGK